MKNETKIKRETEIPRGKDPYGDETIKRFAIRILDMVNDEKLHRVVALKVARAICERRISSCELSELLDTIRTRSKEIRSPGAYFTTSVKRIFAAAGLQWNHYDKGELPAETEKKKDYFEF